tara:strand:- start:796 stop:1077 length:282 start_codon:yes stop_codon:yes gene_type:complete
MHNEKLDRLRKKIDKVDHKLLNVIKKRTNLVKKVIKEKKFKKQIVDRNRIKKVLKNIKNLSNKKKIDHKLTRKIWISMINSYIEYEKRNFNKK